MIAKSVQRFSEKIMLKQVSLPTTFQNPLTRASDAMAMKVPVTS
jgi:hypothetical protein